MENDTIASPSGVSLVGGLAVVAFYWVHLAASGIDIGAGGVEITLFISAFLAQYIPLEIIRTKLEEN